MWHYARPLQFCTVWLAAWAFLQLLCQLHSSGGLTMNTTPCAAPMVHSTQVAAKQASVSGWGSAKFCHTHSLAILFVSDFCQVQSIPIPRAQGMSYTLPADRPQETLLDSGFFRSFNMKFCPHKSLQVLLTSVKLHRHAEFFALWPLLVWGLLSYMPSNKLKCCWLCWAHLEIGIELDDGQIR